MKKDIFQHAALKYNPLQEETAKYINDDCNLVVLSPTSSGKTICAEQYIAPTLEAHKKAIYLSPLKALTNEKLEDWSLKVPRTCAITGDTSVSPVSFTNDLLLMTTEALDSKTRGHASWIDEVGVIVSDESHLLASAGRGDAFEVGLTRFAQINPGARIVFLSATIPNAQELADWLTVLNGKPTRVVETTWRPVVQTHTLMTLPNNHWKMIDRAASLIGGLRKKHRGKQMLIFVHTISMGQTLSKRLKCPFHYSKVPMDERRRLEAAFKEKSIHTMVSTSTLAYGLNLPADVGVIVAAHRGPDMVDIADLKQEAGRIGRYGLSTEGKVFYLFPERYAESVFEALNKVPDIKSVLPKRLYFHITSLVTREGMQRKEVNAFLGKTLAAQQGTINVQEAFDILKEFEILREDSSGLLKPTPIARGSALMYVDPLDLYFWKRGFSGKPTEPEDIARAYVGIPSMEYQVHMPAELKDPLDMPFKQQQVVGSALRDWLAGKPSDGYRAMIIPMIVRDFDRIASALKLAGVNKNYVESLSLMMKYGIREDLIDLVKVKGIGRKRAMALFQKGIKTPKEVTRNQQIAINILGRKLFEDVKKSVFSPGTFVLRF